MTSKRTIVGMLVFALAGCGGASITPELRSARDTVDRARESEAAVEQRAQLRRAEQLLAQAEAAPDGSPEERDLAYVADRMARIAISKANASAIRREMDEEERRYRSELERAAIEHRTERDHTEAQLAQVQAQLADVRARMAESAEASAAELAQRERQLAMREQQLLAALAAYADAEARAQAAMDALRELATVRQEGDETVVTIPGEVLFEYNQADLRPTARQRLRAVAEALEANPNAQIVVEGHTDSIGSDEFNLQLSQRRAEAVRQFLVDEGIAMGRIRAVGRGEEEPIADNDTAEGRAENRRVEIHFRPERARVTQR